MRLWLPLATAVMLVWSAARAEETPAPEPPRAVEEESMAPPVDLLDFLGQWETGTEEWIDPLELERLMREVEDEDAGSL